MKVIITRVKDKQMSRNDQSWSACSGLFSKLPQVVRLTMAILMAVLSEALAKSVPIALTTRPLNCKTTVWGPDPDKPCVFPFTFNGVTYNNCTNHMDPEDLFWCSTLTDSWGIHVKGNGSWGYCDQRCDFSTIHFSSHSNADDQPEVEEDPDLTEDKDGQSVIYDLEVSPELEVADLDALFATTTGLKDTTTTTTKISSRPDSSQSEESPGKAPVGLNVTSVAQLSGDTHRGDWLPTSESGTCGFSTTSGYILGGASARKGEFPFAAALGYQQRSMPRSHPGNPIVYSCGGALINRRYVVTAAHCHSSKNVQLQVAEVVLGQFDLSWTGKQQLDRGRQVFRISERDVTHHPGFSQSQGTLADDIALIRLPRPATTVIEDPDSNVLPICLDWTATLPKMEEASSVSPGGQKGSSPGLGQQDRRNRRIQHEGPYEDTRPHHGHGLIMVVGWGRTDNSALNSGNLEMSGAFSSVLQKLEVPLVPLRECQSMHYSRTPLEPGKQLCAGGREGADSCGGDSGGPLIYRRSPEAPAYLIGVVSFGTKICGSGRPGVYTNVEHYLPWIKDSLRS